MFAPLSSRGGMTPFKLRRDGELCRSHRASTAGAPTTSKTQDVRQRIQRITLSTAITRFLYVGVQGTCDRPWQRAIWRSFADDVRHIADVFGKAQLDAIVMVLDDFLLGAIAGCQPRRIVVVGGAAKTRLIALGPLQHSLLLYGLLFRSSPFRFLLFEKQLLLFGMLLRSGSQSFQRSLRFELSVSVRQIHEIIISDTGRSQHYGRDNTKPEDSVDLSSQRQPLRGCRDR
jgi:hypothetical protein